MQTTYQPMTGPAPLCTSLNYVKGKPMARWYCAVFMVHASKWEAHTDFYLDIQRGVTIVLGAGVMP